MKKPSYLFMAIILLAAYLTFISIRPLISAILGSFILTFAFYPLYLKLNEKIKSKNLCSAITLVVILLILIIPSIIITNSLAKESVSAYQKLKQKDFSLIIAEYLDPSLQSNVSEVLNNALLFIIRSTSDFILSIPNLALSFFITLFLTYYLLKEAPAFLAHFKNLIPIKEEDKKVLFEKFKVTTKALIFGTVLTAIIQGILGGIGFTIFGISSPVLWGFIMAVTSMIPLLGTAIVWLPAGIIQILQQDYFSGIGIILYGALIVGTVDNVIKPKIIGKRANLHPAIVLLGVIGGINLLGFIGIIVGPLILALAIELFKAKINY